MKTIFNIKILLSVILIAGAIFVLASCGDDEDPVNSDVISTTTARFKWNTTTVELDKANNWSTTLLTDRVAVSNVSDKKQYILVWTGGFTTGDKTNASLRIVEENKTTEVVTLTNLEIQASTSSLYSVVFNTATQSGELVLTR